MDVRSSSERAQDAYGRSDIVTSNERMDRGTNECCSVVRRERLPQNTVMRRRSRPVCRGPRGLRVGKEHGG